MNDVRAYHQLLRGPRWRWWRPLLSLLLVVAFAGVAVLVLSLAGEAYETVGGPLGSIRDDSSAVSTLELDLILAALIPVAGLATWATHRIRPRFVSSVVGGVRWRWLLRCVVVTLPVWVVYLGVSALIEPPTPGRPAQWVVLLVMALVITPFQAAGEEYLFRGWLVQNVGSYFGRPMVGLVVSTVVSAALFALAHGSLDPWVILSIATLAVAACWANWRTGGLEAGIALHLVNNVTVGVLTITVGGYADSFVSEATQGTLFETVIGVVVHAVAVVLICGQGRRLGVQRFVLSWAPTPPAVTADQSVGPLAAPADPVAADDPATDRPIWTAPLG